MKLFGIGLRGRRGLPDREFTGSIVSVGAKPGGEVPEAAVSRLASHILG